MADERDPKLSQRYRELGGEEPSRELDQAILAAAHRAADKPHAPLVTPAGRHRWYFSLAAAAILVLAVAVTVQLERQQPDSEAVAVAPAPAPSDRNEGFSYYNQEASREAPPPVLEQRRDAKRAERQKPVERSKVQPGFTPDPAPAAQAPAEPARDAAAASPPVEESRVQENAAKAVAPAEAGAVPRAEPKPAPSSQPESEEQSRSADAIRQEGLFSNQMQSARRREVAPMTSAPRAAPAPAPDSRVAAVAVPLTPERLLERVAELRKEGRHSEADQLLAEFRQRYPDYRISEEMLQKVERKK
jgi:hypothetical protein